MTDCKHKWQGDCTGVKCRLCGLTVSRKEFAKQSRKSPHSDLHTPKKARKENAAESAAQNTDE